MKLKKIEVGKMYETRLGLGKCVRVGGTFPPSVQVNILNPPRGVCNLAPREVIKEIV